MDAFSGADFGFSIAVLGIEISFGFVDLSEFVLEILFMGFGLGVELILCVIVFLVDFVVEGIVFVHFF